MSAVPVATTVAPRPDSASTIRLEELTHSQQELIKAAEQLKRRHEFNQPLSHHMRAGEVEGCKEIEEEIEEWNSITQILARRILPNIPSMRPSGSTMDETNASNLVDGQLEPPPATPPIAHLELSSRVSVSHLNQATPLSTTPWVIHQLRELFKPHLRCNQTDLTATDRSIDLIERWIFQLNDHHMKSITTDSREKPKTQPPTKKSSAASRGDSVFSGTVFCVSGSFTISPADLRKLIIINGGDVTDTPNKKCTFFVTDSIGSSKSMKAQKDGIKIVTELWVHGSIARGQMSTEKKYFLSSGGDSTPSQMASTTSTTNPTTHDIDVLCDLFHPLMISSGQTTSVRTTTPLSTGPVLALAANEYKLNEAMMTEGGDEMSVSKKVLQVNSQSSPVVDDTSASYFTLMDLIIDLYSEFGICHYHENKYLDPGSPDWKLTDFVYGAHLQELTRLPHRLWVSWSKNQRPLIQPLIQPHLIPDLAHVTLEYLLGDESTVPVQIERKPQPTYRWRFPLLEWRQSADPTAHRYSPDFELDGHRWRIIIRPINNFLKYVSCHDCMSGFIEARDTTGEFDSISATFKFVLIHPHRSDLSLIRCGKHRFQSNSRDLGFNNLLSPDQITDIVDEDGSVVMEVSISKNICDSSGLG